MKKTITLFGFLLLGAAFTAKAQDVPTVIKLLDFETEGGFTLETWDIEGDGIVDNPYKMEGNLSDKVLKITGDSRGFRIKDEEGIFDFEGDTWIEYDLYCDIDLGAIGNPWYTEDVYLFSGADNENNNKVAEQMWGGRDKQWYHVKTPILSKQAWFVEGATYDQLLFTSWCMGTGDTRKVYYDNIVLKTGDYNYVSGFKSIKKEAFAISQENNQITVKGEGILCIYNLLGNRVKEVKVTECAVVELMDGTYIASMNGLTQKIIIR